MTPAPPIPSEPANGIATLDVGVVVVTFNSSSVVSGLLDTLDDGLSGLRWAAVFVDNDSTDGTASMLRAAGREVLDLAHNAGYAAAINRGTTRFAHARAVLVLNSDVALTSGAGRTMVEVLDDPAVGVVAPMTRFTDDGATLDLTQRREPSLARTWGTALLGGRLSKRLGLSEEVSDLARYREPADVDWAVGAALLISRECVDAVGDWDESFFLYSEETDFCRRARRAGFLVRYTPEALIRHVGGGGAANPRLRAMMVVNKVREYRRRHRAPASWLFLTGNVILEGSRAIAGRAPSRTAVTALVSPRRRPPEINASQRLMPR